MEIPDIEIENSEIDKILNESEEFIRSLEQFISDRDAGYDPKAGTEAMDQYNEKLEIDADKALDIILDEALASMDINVLNPSEISTNVSNMVDKVTIDTQSVETMNDVIQEKPIEKAQVESLQQEASTQTEKIQEEISQEPDPLKQKELVAADSLAQNTLKNVAEKPVPREGGWESILQNLAKWLLTFLVGFGTIGFGIYALSLISKALTGCYLYYDGTKRIKLVCDDSHDYNNDDMRANCRCLTSFDTTDCTTTNPLISESSTQDTIMQICQLSEQTSDRCEHNEKFYKNPICTLANNFCFNSKPMVCDLKGRTVYYSYEKYNWSTLLSNIFSNWPDLYEKPVNAFERLIKFVIYAVIIIVVSLLVYNVSKLIVKRLNYRVDNNQMRYVTQTKKQISQKK